MDIKQFETLLKLADHLELKSFDDIANFKFDLVYIAKMMTK